MIRKWYSLAILALAPTLVEPQAFASVKKEGAWPEVEKKVSLDVSATSRSEALRQLGDKAGWSLVVQAPAGDPVDIHVKDQPADKVLELLLAEAPYVAKREGSLISIEREHKTADAPPASNKPAPDAGLEHASEKQPPDVQRLDPPRTEKAEHAQDRSVMGGRLKIEKDEVVQDVSVLGGSVEVLGEVLGDVSVAGGSVVLKKGAHVHGDVSALGGEITIEDEARVDGDVGALGGKITRSEGAYVGGKVGNKNVQLRFHGEHDKDGAKAEETGFGTRLRNHLGGKLTGAAVLFFFGAMLLALGAQRMEQLRVEAAARPMRSLALGIVGGLAATALLVALCVTIVGIPVAIVGVCVATFATYAAISAVLTMSGEVLLRRKTANPYIHLALGCALFMAVGAIPVVGGLFQAAVTLIGIGVLVATRGAGFFPPRNSANVGAGPYRTQASL